MRKADNIVISELVGDLRPIRPLGFARGVGLAIASGGFAVAAVVAIAGLRPDVAGGSLNALFLISAGLFLMLGIASSVTVIMMSRPQVGANHDGWAWPVAMAALLLFSALLMSVGNADRALAASAPQHGIDCLACGIGLGLISGAALTLWLRRGAATSLTLAGLLTGIAAGSFGIFAYSFHCPISNIFHVGLWHSLVVVASAGIGRLVVPPLIRW
ncbi:NrsF family protein [Sphingopyxis sp. P1IMeth2]|uniref:NrsF family protein n=1 Tax=Sphingopyxis sp. P1IMeth2 TaxID=1892848 RepID=UPI001646F004|nr:DUF1109 domain-containing protein [Sphingopyxis sp. P1IMeth2]